MNDSIATAPLRLHIGGEVPHPDWKILNVVPGEHVDFVGSCVDLSRFEDESIEEIYASHVYEHLSYDEFNKALREVVRVLKPNGRFWIAVPDMDVLCQLYLEKRFTLLQRIGIMQMIFGGQTNPYDFHKVGFNLEMLLSLLKGAGFQGAERRPHFGLFKDTSDLLIENVRISLNLIAYK